MAEVWYRAWTKVQHRAVSFDCDGEPTFHDLLVPRVALHFDEFKVLRRTAKGVWLDVTGFYHDGSPQTERFVLRTANKRFACPTKKEAVESLIARKKRHRTIVANTLKSADAALAALDSEADDFLRQNDANSIYLRR